VLAVTPDRIGAIDRPKEETSMMERTFGSKRTLGFVLGAIIVGVAGSGHAGVIGPKRPSQLVELVRGPATLACQGPAEDSLRLLAPDGSTSAFSVPPGQVLILTGLRWFSDGDATPGILCGVDVDKHSGQRIVTDAALVMPTIGGGGFVTHQTSLDNVVISPGTELCVQSGGCGRLGAQAYVTGYLTSDK
jgi:hypothetical protein